MTDEMGVLEALRVAFAFLVVVWTLSAFAAFVAGLLGHVLLELLLLGWWLVG